MLFVVFLCRHASTGFASKLLKKVLHSNSISATSLYTDALNTYFKILRNRLIHHFVLSEFHPVLLFDSPLYNITYFTLYFSTSLRIRTRVGHYLNSQIVVALKRVRREQFIKCCCNVFQDDDEDDGDRASARDRLADFEDSSSDEDNRNAIGLRPPRLKPTPKKVFEMEILNDY